MTPGTAISVARTDKRGQRSAAIPPSQYPRLSAARTTLMRLPHTKMELPKYGASIRLPTISRAIKIGPAHEDHRVQEPRVRGGGTVRRSIGRLVLTGVGSVFGHGARILSSVVLGTIRSGRERDRDTGSARYWRARSLASPSVSTSRAASYRRTASCRSPWRS